MRRLAPLADSLAFDVLLPPAPPAALLTVGRRFSPGPGWRRGALLLAGAVLLLAAGVYFAMVGSLWKRQESLLFHGDPLPAGYQFQLPPDVHETQVTVPGGRLDALHLQLPHPRGVVFFLHGNSGNLSTWFGDLDFYRQANFDLYMLDYRGFGKSSGHIQSEMQMHEDVRAAWAQIAARYRGLKTVFYGRSLGTGLAATLAAEVQPSLTVLVSPYSSMQAMVHERFPYVPAFLLNYPLRTDEAIPHIQGPVLLIHGDRDTMIPVSHSSLLLSRAHHASLLRLPDAAHDDVQDSPAYQAALKSALLSL